MSLSSVHNFCIAIRYVLVRNIWYFEMKGVYEVYGFDGGTQEPHNIVLRERWKKMGIGIKKSRLDGYLLLS